MTRVVVASDKFKGSLTSNQVATTVAEGVRRTCPDATVDAVPVADGGDGTLAAAVAAGFEFVPATASGPTGEAVRTGYARRRVSTDHGGHDVAVVELADVSGLVRLPAARDRAVPEHADFVHGSSTPSGPPYSDGAQSGAIPHGGGFGRPAPLTASSRGTGEVIAAAIDKGCTRIILGIGGSASTDGGAGLIRALGAKLLDADGAPVGEGGGALAAAASLDLTDLRERMAGVEVVVACDVDNPLTGPAGAAAVYGPQKGADADQVAELDDGLARWADLVARETGRDVRDAPGAGAAGGVGFAALALLGAELRPGIELMLELVGFHQQLAGADLVVTGEGALDEQTLHGKAVTGVAAAAGAAGVPVVAVCGTNRLDPARLRAAGVEAAYALTDLEPDVRRCIAEPIPLLRQLGERIAADHLARSTMTATERGFA
ncbi:glycerate kinase [Kribbella turkmenica]|uniref:Glycerate kinase n=1 Tax=Kribbella turkmenica TaxID=2530375 RepID=A0A4R4X367_9ACTN|nr:glycerate kinase [Kribbella turkmenica]TDD24659.1 glycerate kinase [Kribbella turkmenica]